MYRGEETDGENNTARAILNALGGTAFLAFKTIHEWHLRGLINLHDMQLVLRKHGVENLLLLDSLSDGERVFVGRMALFYLLRDEKDALVLLDEPETHFNDFWKRQMVDIVDDSLGDDPNDVVLTTHSSIALTDAFTSEVTVLQNDNGQVTANQPRIQTFGASPTEILQDVFNAPDSIGQRASEYLDMVLVLAENPEDIELWWNNESNDTLAKFIKSVENAYRARRVPAPSESDLQKRIPEVLRALGELSSKNIAIAIELLYNKLGSGYYRFEFHQRLIAIRNNTDLE
nr:AAA family ATPase [Armatimonas rosea]